jgi:phospholipid-binding lipoprotein MlaA
MNCLLFPALFLAFLTVACGHSPSRVSSPALPAGLFASPWSGEAPGSEQVFPKSPGIAAESESGNPDSHWSLHDPEPGAKKDTLAIAARPDLSTNFPLMAAITGDESSRSRENLQDEELGEEEEATISDPLEPFNRAMFHFNDKLYFWALKPVAQGYNWVVPEKARVSVKNFFSNLAFPVRFISCILQADFKGAAAEFGRFTVNTIWGVGGLLDPSSSEQLNLPKGDADLGETLGVYGLGQGFYLVWPVLGPSSARDSVGIVGDFFLYPVSYIRPWPAWLGVRTYEEVNDASLRIGDYESLKQAAIDPYLALRDAYRQYRQKKVEARKGQPEPPKPGGVR